MHHRSSRGSDRSRLKEEVMATGKLHRLASQQHQSPSTVKRKGSPPAKSVVRNETYNIQKEKLKEIVLNAGKKLDSSNPKNNYN
nr:hypothetical protein Iba_chr08dCG2900 [Ipomoea batatas]